VNTTTRREVLLTVGSAAGYGLGLAALITAVGNDYGRGMDAYAFWVAGRNVLEGRELYASAAIGGLGAYWYPPIFAQLWAPLALLPELAFTWLWRVFCFLCLRWLAGSWRATGLWLLFPFTITELSAANVTLPVAAATFAALRGEVRALPWAALLKFGPILCLPFLWIARPASRRVLVRAFLVALGVCLLSFASLPSEWLSYLRHMASSTAIDNTGPGLIAILPSPIADFGLRLGVALVLLVAAIAFRSERAVYVAATIAVPTLWVARLTPLLALPRLAGGDVQRARRAVGSRRQRLAGFR
jgi:hypothetical protein